MRRRRTIEDDDGVAVVSGYIINIGVAMMVITMLVLGLQGTVDDVQEVAQSTTLKVTGEQIASKLAEADAMANAGDSRGRIRVDVQGSLAAQGYSLSVSNDSVDLASGTANVSVAINTTNAVVNSSVTGGGTHVIQFNATHIWLAG